MELTLRCIPIRRIPHFHLTAFGEDLEFLAFDEAVKGALIWPGVEDLVATEMVRPGNYLFPYIGPWTLDQVLEHADKVAATLGVRIELDSD